MEQQTVSPPDWADFPPMEWASRKVSDTPIHDALRRQWLAEGRAVPRRPGPPSGALHGMTTGDLFQRA